MDCYFVAVAVDDYYVDAGGYFERGHGAATDVVGRCCVVFSDYGYAAVAADNGYIAAFVPHFVDAAERSVIGGVYGK